jgi:hypothetical protein
MHCRICLAGGAGEQAAAGLGDISGASVWYHFAHIELAPQVEE